MPPSAAPLEIALFWPCFFGLLAAFALLAAAVARLIGRYRDRRNGAARLLAWERVTLCLVIVGGLFVGLMLASLLLLTPASGAQPTGGVEQWARDTGRWFNLPAILVMLYALIALPIVLFAYQTRLDWLMRDETKDWSPDRHPNRRRDDPPQTPPPPREETH